MKKVAILGCGPAGLMAAHAANLTRLDFAVFSRPEKSVLSGAQFLHEHIPDLTHVEADGFLRVRKWGGSEGYAEKVYNDRKFATSFDQFQTGLMPAWSLRKAYEELWERYKGCIVTKEITPPFATLMTNDFDLVISTVPAPALCYQMDHHTFHMQAVKITEGHEVGCPDENFMCYSGDKRDRWYRTSRIFGVSQTEWPWVTEHLHDPQVGRKPTTNTCDCHRQIMRAGRFGKWQKGVLTHHVFQEVIGALQQL